MLEEIQAHYEPLLEQQAKRCLAQMVVDARMIEIVRPHLDNIGRQISAHDLPRLVALPDDELLETLRFDIPEMANSIGGTAEQVNRALVDVFRSLVSEKLEDGAKTAQQAQAMIADAPPALVEWVEKSLVNAQKTESLMDGAPVKRDKKAPIHTDTKTDERSLAPSTSPTEIQVTIKRFESGSEEETQFLKDLKDALKEKPKKRVQNRLLYCQMFLFVFRYYLQLLEHTSKMLNRVISFEADDTASKTTKLALDTSLIGHSFIDQIVPAVKALCAKRNTGTQAEKLVKSFFTSQAKPYFYRLMRLGTEKGTPAYQNITGIVKMAYGSFNAALANETELIDDGVFEGIYTELLGERDAPSAESVVYAGLTVFTERMKAIIGKDEGYESAGFVEEVFEKLFPPIEEGIVALANSERLQAGEETTAVPAATLSAVTHDVTEVDEDEADDKRVVTEGEGEGEGEGAGAKAREKKKLTPTLPLVEALEPVTGDSEPQPAVPLAVRDDLARKPKPVESPAPSSGDSDDHKQGDKNAEQRKPGRGEGEAEGDEKGSDKTLTAQAPAAQSSIEVTAKPAEPTREDKNAEVRVEIPPAPITPPPSEIKTTAKPKIPSPIPTSRRERDSEMIAQPSLRERGIVKRGRAELKLRAKASVAIRNVLTQQFTAEQLQVASEETWETIHTLCIAASRTATAQLDIPEAFQTNTSFEDLVWELIQEKAAELEVRGLLTQLLEVPEDPLAYASKTEDHAKRLNHEFLQDVRNAYATGSRITSPAVKEILALGKMLDGMKGKEHEDIYRYLHKRLSTLRTTYRVQNNKLQSTNGTQGVEDIMKDVQAELSVFLAPEGAEGERVLMRMHSLTRQLRAIIRLRRDISGEIGDTSAEHSRLVAQYEKEPGDLLKEKINTLARELKRLRLLAGTLQTKYTKVEQLLDNLTL